MGYSSKAGLSGDDPALRPLFQEAVRLFPHYHRLTEDALSRVLRMMPVAPTN